MTSPFAIDHTFEFARAPAVEGEDLGEDKITDILAISGQPD